MKKRTFSTINLILKWLAIIPIAAIIFTVIPSCKGKAKPSAASSEDSTTPPPPPPPSPLPYNINNGDTVWFRVDELPTFPGGSLALSDCIAKSFTYPEPAKKKNIQGRVVVGFVLTKECKIVDVKIVTGIDPDCDKEAIRVVTSLPQFEKPAFVKGKPVAYHFTLPVHYTLQ
jgi:TonB family protein